MEVCNYCGCTREKRIPRFRNEYNEFLCYHCYEHYKLHPKNTIPPKGVVAYDDLGRLVCHICGRAYDRLTSHLRFKHGVSQEDYKEEFGLNRSFRLTSEYHKEVMRKYTPTKDVREISKGTRYGSGRENGRKGTKNRLQSKINKENKKIKEDSEREDTEK